MATVPGRRHWACREEAARRRQLHGRSMEGETLESWQHRVTRPVVGRLTRVQQRACPQAVGRRPWRRARAGARWACESRRRRDRAAGSAFGGGTDVHGRQWGGRGGDRDSKPREGAERYRPPLASTAPGAWASTPARRECPARAQQERPERPANCALPAAPRPPPAVHDPPRWQCTSPCRPRRKRDTRCARRRGSIAIPRQHQIPAPSPGLGCPKRPARAPARRPAEQLPATPRPKLQPDSAAAADREPPCPPALLPSSLRCSSSAGLP